MKLIFASDIHGSLFFCEKLIDQYEKEQPDKLILLGDLLYHGPKNNLTQDYNTMQVAKLLNSIKKNIICVRGNCDAEVDQSILEFPISADFFNLYINDRLIFLTHGHIYNKNHLPILNDGDIIIHGHTHIPAIEKINNIIYMNPGSVSLPRGNSVNSFMLYHDNLFEIKDFSDNIIMKYEI